MNFTVKKLGLLWLIGLLMISVQGAEKRLNLQRAQTVLQPAVVDVVFTLQYNDAGEVPVSCGLYCAACSTFHDRNLASILHNNSKLQLSGFLVTENSVIVPDMLIDQDSIQSITVQSAGNSTAAEIVAVYPERGALLLKLAQTLPGTKPLKLFPVPEQGELFAYSRIRENGYWVSRLQNFSRQRPEEQYEQGELLHSIPGSSIILTADGKVVALLGNNNGSFERDPWSLPYTQWKKLTMTDFLRSQQQLKLHLQRAIMPVTVFFKAAVVSRRERLNGVSGRREIYSYVCKLPDGKLFMPLLTAPPLNSRLEKILIHLPQGSQVAQISRVLKDFGGVELLCPAAADLLPPIAAETVSLNSAFGSMTWGAGIAVYNQMLDIKVFCDALGAIARGYKDQPFGVLLKGQADEMLFTLDGKLLALAIQVRAFNYQTPLRLISAQSLQQLLNDPQDVCPFANMCNPPQAEADLGIEYQALDRGLASAGKVEHWTRSGQEGLLVSFVYPDSLAAKIGLEPGDILLKLILPGGGAPIRLLGNDFKQKHEQQFPWEKLDAIPEMYFSEIPEPWKSIRNPLNRQLSLIGIGQNAELILIHRNKLVKKHFTITASPVYYEIAPSYRSSALGVEVRDMTYEVKRYFRMSSQAPGVIVADVFAGSPAATAGVRPFEIITAVNDHPVNNVKDFQKAVSGADEIRLAIRRLAAPRMVTVRPQLGPIKK